MAALSPEQLAGLVRRHFPPGLVPQTGEQIRVTAYAVARAESGGRPDAVGDQGNSIGLWQIYRPAHPQYSRAWLFDPENNAEAARAVAAGGWNWNPWCTWERTACGGAGNSSYRARLPEARAALADAPPPGPPPPAAAPGGAGPLILLAGGVLLLLYGRGSSKRRAAGPR